MHCLVVSGARVGIVPPSDAEQLKVLTLSDSWAVRSLHVGVRRQSLDTKPFLYTLISALCGTPAWAELGHKRVAV
jgi:hypothetical protein